MDGTVGATTSVLAAIVYVAHGSDIGEEPGTPIVISTPGWEVVNVPTSTTSHYISTTERNT